MPPPTKSDGKAEPFRNEETPEIIVVIISSIYLVWDKSWSNINKMVMDIVRKKGTFPFYPSHYRQEKIEQYVHFWIRIEQPTDYERDWNEEE